MKACKLHMKIRKSLDMRWYPSRLHFIATISAPAFGFFSRNFHSSSTQFKKAVQRGKCVTTMSLAETWMDNSTVYPISLRTCREETTSSSSVNLQFSRPPQTGWWLFLVHTTFIEIRGILDISPFPMELAASISLEIRVQLIGKTTF